jgi:hypothetical protein
MTELGAGPALDRSLDFTIDSTGDIDAVSGNAELQKDVAFQLQILLQEYLGQPLSTDVQTDIQATTANVLNSDNRVQSVDERSIQVQQTRGSGFAVSARAQTDSGEQEFVIQVTNR